MFENLTLWIVFHVGVVFLLVLDLFVLHRKPHEVPLRESLYWIGFWVGLALLFNIWVGYYFGKEAAITFLTAYLIEESLSVDNLFVFLMIFTYFDVPNRYHHRLLFWGVLGAIIMRGICIVAGTVLLQKFDWLTYIFAAILFFTGFRMLLSSERKIDFEQNLFIRGFRKLIPVTSSFGEGKFFVRDSKGRLAATRFFLVLLVIESTDLLFAVDSIPAVLGITTDPFIAYTSNVCAVLGLRSIYFALAALSRMFRYLQTGTAIVILVVAVKMMLHDFIDLSALVTLTLTVAVLAGSVIASILIPKKS